MGKANLIMTSEFIDYLMQDRRFSYLRRETSEGKVVDRLNVTRKAGNIAPASVHPGETSYTLNLPSKSHYDCPQILLEKVDGKIPNTYEAKAVLGKTVNADRFMKSFYWKLNWVSPVEAVNNYLGPRVLGI